MKIIKAGYEILTPIDRDRILKSIEETGRVCYRSEDRITEGSASEFVRGLVKRGHLAMIEHQSLTVKFICDRGVSHEIVRHRLASFAQESTRYCNYSKEKFRSEITVIEPCFAEINSPEYFLWESAMRKCEDSYFTLLKRGWKPEQARAVLPNSLKTELVVTMNMRSWRHFFELRTEGAAHPQLREITIPLLGELRKELPEIFEGIKVLE